MAVIAGWLEEGMGRPEAAWENKMKLMPLGNLHCAHGGEQVSVLHRLSWSHCASHPSAAQVQTVLNCLAVLSAVKCCSAALGLCWTGAGIPNGDYNFCKTIRLLYHKIFKALLQFSLFVFLFLNSVSRDGFFNLSFV